MVSNIGDFFINAVELFNLFSCFGNISKVLFMTNLRKALIEYLSASATGKCVSTFMKHSFQKIGLKVSYSKYQTIDINQSANQHNSAMYNDIFIAPMQA